MPLIKGKSENSFKKNVATEMRAHPDKRAQDLAIAYSIKRKAQKKMAMGGEVNEDLDPMHPSPKIAEDQVYADQRLSHQELSDGQLPQPEESMKHYLPEAEDVPDHIVEGLMKVRKMAQGGQLPENEEYLDEGLSYPDPEDYEYDSLDPHQHKMADGGPVLPGADDAQASMRKAFKFADGGVLPEPSPSPMSPLQSAQESMRNAFHDSDSDEERRKKRLKNAFEGPGIGD